MTPPEIVEPDQTQQSGSRQLQLVIHAGPLAGKGFPITGRELTFGRDPDNNIVLDDTEVSRHHARLIRRQNQVILEDLGSTNGTLVNGQRISGEHVLQPADIISIGISVFGVKGFAAPKTVGITQVAGAPPTFLTYTPSRETTHQPPDQEKTDDHSQQSGGLNLLTVGLIMAVIFIILLAAAVTAWVLTRDNGPTTASAPQAVITAPVNNSQVRVNQPVTIQTTATDAGGITRVELWISGQKTDETVSPAAQGQPTLTASFQWIPPAPGSYTIEIRPYNNQETLGTPALITVNAVSGTELPPQTPTATLTPPPPTATAPTSPLLITKTDLNVRGGPGLIYDILGLLTAESQATLLGRSDDGEWWQIAFSGATNGVGWVSSNPAYADVFNTDGLPVIPAPPPPTATPTETSTPTNTPTVTPIPPTNTPTPTSTPTKTSEAVVIQFEVQPATIEGGECVEIKWNISGVNAIYYDGQGVTGSGEATDCPPQTKTYQVRIVLKDDTEKIEERTVTVVNPIQSSGTKSLAPNQTIDFDRGDVPGDDFIWNVADGIRKFEVQGSVQLAPMPDISDLKNLSLSKCAAATFGVYTFIDGSDVVLDPVNELIPGRAACYKTSQGRLGKLRFPQAGVETLPVEWLTWQ